MIHRIRRWLRQRFHASGPLERGDVPGWVMIVIMTAGLVIIIWAVAGELLENVFRMAIDRILEM